MTEELDLVRRRGTWEIRCDADGCPWHVTIHAHRVSEEMAADVVRALGGSVRVGARFYHHCDQHKETL